MSVLCRPVKDKARIDKTVNKGLRGSKAVLLCYKEDCNSQQDPAGKSVYKRILMVRTNSDASAFFVMSRMGLVQLLQTRRLK